MTEKDESKRIMEEFDKFIEANYEPPKQRMFKSYAGKQGFKSGWYNAMSCFKDHLEYMGLMPKMKSTSKVTDRVVNMTKKEGLLQRIKKLRCLNWSQSVAVKAELNKTYAEIEKEMRALDMERTKCKMFGNKWTLLNAKYNFLRDFVLKLLDSKRGAGE